MKLRRFTKLALAGTALAATAATLTTATYAWYVSNAETQATGVQGTVAAAQTSNNLLIAKDTLDANDKHKAGVYGPKATFTTSDLGDSYNLLSPQTYVTQASGGEAQQGAWATAVWRDNDGNLLRDVKKREVATGKYKAGVTYYSGSTVDAEDALVAGTNYTVGDDIDETVYIQKDAYDNTRFIKYSFWLLGASTNALTPLTVNVGLTSTNTTASVNDVKQVSYNNTGSNVTKDETFAVDAVNALHMTVVSQTKDSNAEDGLSSETVVYNDYDVKTFSTNYTDAEGFATLSGKDSNVYYLALKGASAYGTAGWTNGTPAVANPAGTSPTFGTTSLTKTLTLVHNTETLYTVYMWLEGTDSACFDSCKQQSFSFVWDFSVTNA